MPAKQFWTDKYKNNNHKLACIFFYTAVNYELNIILRTITFFQPGIAANTIYLKTASAKINHYPLGLCSICFGIQKIKSHVIHKRVFSITKKMNSQNHIFKSNEENGISCLWYNKDKIVSLKYSGNWNA